MEADIEREPTTHSLKTWPQYFERVVSGQKKFEVRKNDRDFQVNDVLILEWYDPEQGKEKPMPVGGVFARCTITYILHGPKFGIEEGYCVMGIELEEHGF